MTTRKFSVIRNVFVRATPAALVAIVLAISAAPAAHTQTFTVIHTFTFTDGSSPNGDLIRDVAGNFYGTAQTGGASGRGVVFKLDPLGNETVLYSFTGQTDGGIPIGRLFRDSAGGLYGFTASGGDATCSCGSVFKLATDGTLTVLHAFHGGTDGMEGVGYGAYGLVSINGEFYGATTFGGTPGCDGSLGCGVIFKVTQGGAETVLYRFTGGADGAFPGDLIRDQAGNLYGVTGGSYTGANDGAVFKFDTAGTLTVLYNFTGGADGGSPGFRLTAGANGVVYGSTAPSNGVVFSLDTTTGKETVLHVFGTRPGDGLESDGALLNAAGNLYGNAAFGGITNSICTLGCGVVYGIGRTGQYGVLYRFTGAADGWGPAGALSQDGAGSLYGATMLGGSGDNGVIFKIAP